jgi:hypothetical protein
MPREFFVKMKSVGEIFKFHFPAFNKISDQVTVLSNEKSIHSIQKLGRFADEHACASSLWRDVKISQQLKVSLFVGRV